MLKGGTRGEKTLRIIAGIAKGRTIKAVKGMKTRPTSDRVKEALFSILQDKIADAKVLDLFAGTGNLGLEALSRGARSAIFVEKDWDAIGVIRDNINSLGLSEGKLIKGDVFKVIDSLGKREQFDIIFADPPYRKGFAEKVISAIDKSRILALNGVLVVEQGKGEEKISEAGGLTLVRDEKYGDTFITFYKWSMGDPSRCKEGE